MVNSLQYLRAYFEKIAPITDRDWELFSANLIRAEFPKKTSLLKMGEVENYISFIEKGVVRFFLPKSVDKEITFAITFENELVCAYDSFLKQCPSEYFVETITPTTLIRFDRRLLQKMYVEIPLSNTIGRILSEEIFLIKAKRELLFLKYSPLQRYLNLFEEKPRLIKDIPLKYLASYIGITPQALSRIRKRIS